MPSMHRSSGYPTMSEPCEVRSDGITIDFNAILRLIGYDSFTAKSLPRLQYCCYSRDQFVCPFRMAGLCLPSQLPQSQFGHSSTWRMSERCTQEKIREPFAHTTNASHQVPDRHDHRLTHSVTSTDESRLTSNQQKGKSVCLANKPRI